VLLWPVLLLACVVSGQAGPHVQYRYRWIPPPTNKARTHTRKHGLVPSRTTATRRAGAGLRWAHESTTQKGYACRGRQSSARNRDSLGGTGTGLGQFDWVRPRLYTRHKNTNRAARARSHAGSVYIVVSKRNVAVTSENRARKFAVATDAHAPEPKDEGEHKHVTSGDRVVGRDIYHTQYHITLFEYVSPA
jgi:hypothetical protein